MEVGNILGSELEDILAVSDEGLEAQEEVVSVDELLVDGCSAYMVFLLQLALDSVGNGVVS